MKEHMHWVSLQSGQHPHLVESETLQRHQAQESAWGLKAAAPIIYTPHTLEPLKKIGLGTHTAIKLALKLHAHPVHYSHEGVVVDLRKRLQGVWNAEALAEHGEHMSKLAKHHHWMALPLRPLSVHGAPFSVPRCDQGGLPDEKHAMFLCSCNPPRNPYTNKGEGDVLVRGAASPRKPSGIKSP
eukprot:1140417-Pelagomonas_calceolata.AAC.2